MFRLAIVDPNIDSGAVAVSWCANRELLEALKAFGVKWPKVLLITAPSGAGYHQSRERRQLVDLVDGLTYVDFSRDGSARVFAMVVWRHDEDELRTLALRRNSEGWGTDFLTSDGSRFLPELQNRYGSRRFDEFSWGVTRLQERADLDVEDDGWRAAMANLDVEVPAGCFAKPPPAWEAAWVNHWFRQPPQDECAYRKRRLWAYSLQPPFMLVNWLIRLIATVVAQLALFKEVSWQPVFHLLQNSTDEVFENFQRGNWLWPESWGKHPVGFFARNILPLFSPLGLGVIGLPTYLSSDGLVEFTTLFAHVLLVLVILATAGVALFMGCVIALGWAVERAKGENRAEEERIEYLQPGTVEFLSCDTMVGPRSYRTLPKERRTIRLLFQATKAAVCRPFAR